MINPYTSRICFLLTLCLASCMGQPNTTRTTTNQPLVGGGCDGCELMFVGMPAHINATDTSAGWTEQGQKLLVTGTVYQIDGTLSLIHI